MQQISQVQYFKLFLLKFICHIYIYMIKQLKKPQKNFRIYIYIYVWKKENSIYETLNVYQENYENQIFIDILLRLLKE